MLLSLCLAFSCFTLTVSASDDLEGDGLQIVGIDDVVVSVPEDDGVSAYADVGFGYKSASIQYYSAYYNGSFSTGKLAYSSSQSQGFANSSNLLKNGILGYTTFGNLAPSGAAALKSCSCDDFSYLVKYACTSGSSSKPSVFEYPSSSYLDYWYSQKKFVVGPSSYNITSAAASQSTFFTCLETIYMTMDIAVPASSAFDLSALSWEFDVGTSTATDYYSIVCGSKHIAFDSNIYVDGKQIYSGRSRGLGTPAYAFRAGYTSLANGSLGRLNNFEPYYLTNKGSSPKTFTVGVELVPYIALEPYENISQVAGVGDTATSWGRPCIAYLGPNANKVNYLKVFPGALFVPDASAEGSYASVSPDTSAALSRLSTNGYYYYLYLQSVTAEDIVPAGTEDIVNILNQILGIQDSILKTEQSILSHGLTMIQNQQTMINNQNNIFNTEKEILSTNESILDTNQSIMDALLTNPYTTEYFNLHTGTTDSQTVNGLDDALLNQGDAIADATNRLAYMTGSDLDIGIKDDMSDREEGIANDFIKPGSDGSFSEGDSKALSDVSGQMKDMLNTGASAGDAFDSFNEVLTGGDEYSWFSSTTDQNLNPGASTYSNDNYNYDFYYANQEEVRRRLGLDG